MLAALFEGLALVLQWKPLLFMLIGIVVGFWVGLLPGLGGATTLALMLPFIYGMQPWRPTATSLRSSSACRGKRPPRRSSSTDTPWRRRARRAARWARRSRA